MIPVALTIAGSDPSGGAGLQADLKTFHRFGVYGEAVVTLITVQNTRGVTRVSPLDPDLVVEQIRAVIEDIPPQAAKLGALGSLDIVEAVAREAQRFLFSTGNRPGDDQQEWRIIDRRGRRSSAVGTSDSAGFPADAQSRRSWSPGRFPG